MKKLAGITMILAGLLLVIVPRYILPACEFEGFSRMHCSDTAQAELVTGILLALAGIGTLVLKSRGIGRRCDPAAWRSPLLPLCFPTNSDTATAARCPAITEWCRPSG